MGKISVGPPYFDTVFVPIMAPAIFLMGLAIFSRWKKTDLPALAQRLKWAFGVSAVTALLLPLVLGKWTPMIAFGLLMAVWVVMTAAVHLHERLRQQSLTSLPRAYLGMLVAHLGVAVFITGVTLVKGYEIERDLPMKPGEAVEVGGYVFRFEGVSDIAGPNYTAARGLVRISRDHKEVAVLTPEKRLYTVQNMPMTEAAIDAGLLRDLYVSLGEPVGEEAWALRIYIKPFADWIWAGCMLMALGGLLTLTDWRYRRERLAAGAKP
jgi:cytochrome c-type biogenesis protein CcmF